MYIKICFFEIRINKTSYDSCLVFGLCDYAIFRRTFVTFEFMRTFLKIYDVQRCVIQPVLFYTVNII